MYRQTSQCHSRIGFLLIGVLAQPACIGSDPSEAGTAHQQALFEEAEGPFPREGECDLDDPLFDDLRHRLGPDNNLGPGSLKTLAVPEPSNLDRFIKDRKVAVALGKALFWDMQVGSDGVQACASCHFRAGADPRSKNQIAPSGPNNPDTSFDLPPNTQLTASDFPLHRFANPTDRTSEVLHSTDDVVSSQGVFARDFLGVIPSSEVDEGRGIPDNVFNVGGVNTRRVEPRNTPTVINAVFNHRNFWDGRADPIFNGVNGFGARDPDARVLEAERPESMEFVRVRIDNASLASQAVEPPVSNLEMGFFGRPFRDIGKRLVPARPLAQQEVHPNDSVLGDLAVEDGKGLKRTYGRMIRQAFQPRWWRGRRVVRVDGAEVSIEEPSPRQAPPQNQYSMMEYNFSLFFGLAVQMYEATLVSDDAKIDRHFDNLVQGKPGVLNEQELFGMELFDEAGCADCHSGPELTNASVRTAATGFVNPEADPQFQVPEQIERMLVGNCEARVYDQGFYNIGVRPWTEDLGIAAEDPFGNPLSAAVIATSEPEQIPTKELLEMPIPQFADTGKIPPIQPGEATAVTGAFKVPGLRNVELTAPYFHDGGKLTLRQVIEFYNRGGDFHDFVSADGTAQDEFMDLGIGRLELTEEEIDALVAFLETLTDPRVAAQSAPFDHPQLMVPNGHPGDALEAPAQENGLEARENLLVIPERGANGGPLPAGFLE